MKTVILAVIILAILVFAVAYIVRAKKRGDKCIGCPHARQCGKSSCGCGGNEKHNK